MSTFPTHAAFIINSFETEALGGAVWNLTDPLKVDHVLCGARKAGVVLVDCRVKHDDPQKEETELRLKKEGFRSVATTVLLERDCHPDRIPRIDVSIAPPRENEAITLANLACTLMTGDRYRFDPRIPDTLAEKRKFKWMINLVNGRANQIFCARDQDGTLLGFNAAMLKPVPGKNQPACIIDLIAIAEGARKRGIGRTLVARMIDTYREQVSHFSVASYKHNIAALTLYRRAGFVPVNEVTYWRWVSSEAFSAFC